MSGELHVLPNGLTVAVDPLPGAESALRARCLEQIDAARNGSMSFGPRSELIDLSLVAQARGKADRATLDLLTSVGEGYVYFVLRSFFFLSR